MEEGSDLSSSQLQRTRCEPQDAEYKETTIKIYNITSAFSFSSCTITKYYNEREGRSSSAFLGLYGKWHYYYFCSVGQAIQRQQKKHLNLHEEEGDDNSTPKGTKIAPSSWKRCFISAQLLNTDDAHRYNCLWGEGGGGGRGVGLCSAQTSMTTRCSCAHFSWHHPMIKFMRLCQW